MAYQEFDISKDRDAFLEIYNLSHQTFVPQTTVDGTVILGFDEVKLRTVLEISD